MLCNGQDEKGLPPTLDTLHLGCSSYHLHSSHCFLSIWGVVMLVKKKGKNGDLSLSSKFRPPRGAPPSHILTNLIIKKTLL